MSRDSGLGPMPEGLRETKGDPPECDLCGGSLQNVFSKRPPDVRSSTLKDNCGSDVASGEICSEKCCVSDTTGRKNHTRAAIYTAGVQPSPTRAPIHRGFLSQQVENCHHRRKLVG